MKVGEINVSYDGNLEIRPSCLGAEPNNTADVFWLLYKRSWLLQFPRCNLQLTDPEGASAHADPAGETLAGSVGLAVTHVDQVCRLVHREVAVGDDVSAADRPVLHREGTSLPSLRFGGCGAGGQVPVSQVGLDDG